ncbi:MAG: DUF262 domain-containing HNH endonuclease family protein [Ignavibacteria bacterium]|nr:DUF262 domain-containing HNH endonuclease family protein [Ignavibacteria bacterium]
MLSYKTVYSIKGVFTDLLADTEKENFLIPTYQRGYKWSSEAENSQVNTLLMDIYNAYKQRQKFYYLQFITLKSNPTDLEVIDGQQRLTTLTVLSCIIAKYQAEFGVNNFVNNKLIYAVRDNFIKEFIYNNITDLTESESWDKFITERPSHNNQDVYYLFLAAKRIDAFIQNLISKDELLGFVDYFSNKTLLIINMLDNEMQSERIFINVNRGVKLRDEELVKAMLITRIPLEDHERQTRLTEIQINEMRVNIGREWDDIVKWASTPKIKSFYKIRVNNYESVTWVIKLAFPETNSISEQYPLFRYLDTATKNGKLSVKQIFEKIRRIMLTLDDWYNNYELHNLVGYLIHSKNSDTIESVLQTVNAALHKEEAIAALKEMVLKQLPLNKSNMGIRDLKYDDSKNDLFNVFLMLDIAKYLPLANQNKAQYSFENLSDENWTIEHIFPQKSDVFRNTGELSEADLLIIKELLPDSFDDIILPDDENKEIARDIFNKIINSQTSVNFDIDEGETFGIMIEKSLPNLHRLGNLALLQKSINSELSNRFFDEKRKRIFNRISNGEFVPVHTYDVFSKLVISSLTGLHVWTKSDIEEHEKYIIQKIENVVEYLTRGKIG